MQSLFKLIWNQIELEKIKSITAYLNKLRYLPPKLKFDIS